MKTENLEQLKQEFIRIKNMGYVKGTRKGLTGVGKTFEDLHWSIRSGVVELEGGDWDDVAGYDLSGLGSVEVVLSLTVDKHGPDNTGADGVDDRAQKAYSVYL